MVFSGRIFVETKKDMKTIVNKSNIEAAFKNPYGMIISDNPEIKKAVCDHAKSIIAKLHAKK